MLGAVRRDLLTALDYFYTGIQPPKSPKTPADGNPLEEYLSHRQANSHFFTRPPFPAAWSGKSSSHRSHPAESSRTRWRTFATFGYVHDLVPLRRRGGGHHVVASACDRPRKRSAYDGNHPGKTRC